MYKLVVLSALIACTVAAPSGLHGVHVPLITAHSAIIGSIPTSISSQSSSVVHNAILAHAAPALHIAHAAPVVAITAPVVSAHSAVIGSIPTSISSQSSSVVHGATLAHSPILTYSAPTLIGTHNVHGSVINAW